MRGRLRLGVWGKVSIEQDLILLALSSAEIQALRATCQGGCKAAALACYGSLTAEEPSYITTAPTPNR
ncbi:MAG: hypothetical protein ACE5OS_05865 [Anaerolineae bacterium]